MAGTPQLSDDREEMLGVGPGEAARRLVEHEDPAAHCERAGDLDQLLTGGRERACGSVNRNLGMAEPCERRGRNAAHLVSPDQAEPRRLHAEQDVLPDGQMRRDRELLVDHRDARRACAERISRTVRRSVEPHRAGVGAERAGEDRHQRALARAVLTHDRADLAGIDEQIDAVDSKRRAERLPDPAHLEARSGRRSCGVVSYGFFSHRSRSGLRSSAASGEFMSARETTRTPVSMRRSTFCPLMWSTIVFTPR